ncbi:MAG: phage tail tape measure protein [Bacteroidetes bacterium]|jgi:TP901 family phage tail tape measure protein|nr:phage tail tape measure protein [Bacteroidota bacterium]MBT7464010.1 phage tail tape measure protein [Bacteroidota bacterium]
MPREYSREINLYINGTQVKNNLKSIQAEMRKLVNEQARMTIGSQEYVNHTKKIKALRSVMAQHNKQLQQTTRGWQGLSRAAEAFNKYWQMGVTAVAGAVGFVMAFRKTADAANEFEAALDNLSALTGLEGRELEWLGDKAKESSIAILDSGIKIRQSATDITDAYRKMGSQRPELLKDKEALADVTENAIILSEAAKIKLEPAVAALATTMNQFNSSGNKSADIINALAAGSKLGAADIAYLNQAIEKSGTSMNLMGLSVEDNIALIEAVAPKYAEASQAGNSLDKVLLRMKEDQIGYKDGVFDMNRALDELRIRFKAGETATQLFGVRHAKMVEVLVQAQPAYNEFKKGVTGTNIAIEQAIKNTNNNATALEQAKNKVKLMYIVIGEKLAPALVKSTNGWNYLLKALMATPRIIRENQALIIALTGALIAYNAKLLVLIASKIKNRAVTLKNLVVERSVWVARNANLVLMRLQILRTGEVTMVQKRAIVTTRALNATMKANPLGAVIAGLTALIAAYKYYEMHNKRAIDYEKRKEEAINKTTQANTALKETYTQLRTEVGLLNTLSIQEKLDLQQKIKDTISLAEAELLLAETKRNSLFEESKQVKWYQAMLTFDREKLIARGVKNASDAVKVLDEGLMDLRDRLASLRAQDVDLGQILGAEAFGDKIGIETMAAMEEKMAKYTLALQNAKVGGEDYLRVQEKINTLQSEMAKARGVSTSGLSTEVDARAENEKKRLENLRQTYAALRKEIAGSQESIEDLLDEQEKELQDSIEDFEAGDPIKTDYMYWLESTYEGRKELLAQNLKDGVIAHQEYADKIKEIDREMNEAKIQNFENYADAVLSLGDALYNFYEARKQKELSLVIDNDQAKEAIEKKYANRQKAIASVEAAIQGVIEIAKINSNSAVNADLSQTLRILLTGAAVARTVANVALINAQQYEDGLYPVVGNKTGRTYQSAFLGPVKTGLYKKPTLGLFSEKEPEIVIDGTTTRNLMTNFPGILSAIQSARVNQYASGLFPGGLQSSQPESLEPLLMMVMETMRQVQIAHKTPSTVSFRSYLQAQEKYDEIQSRVNL